VAARAGLVRLQLSLATNTMTGSETVSLQHAIHVDNLP
jgi:MSHA biogenesis protein MshO